MKKIIAAAFASGAFLLSGCSNGGYGTVGPANTSLSNGNPMGSTNPNQKAASTALYQPLAALMPYPYDAWFGGSTDGTLNIQPPNQARPAQDAVNGLDGFSTTAPIRERFNGVIDVASLGTPGAVVVVHINTTNASSATVPGKAPVPPPTGKFIPLVGCVKGAANCIPPVVGCVSGPTCPDYMVGVAAEDPTVLEITPLKPLAASTCLPPPPNSPCQGPNAGLGEAYMVLLTKAITVGGVPAVPDTDYANFQAALASGGQTCPSITDPNLNALCQLSGAHLGLAQAILHIPPANVVVSFSFSTQSTLDTLLAAAAQATPQPITVNQAFTAPAMPMTTATFHGLGFADIYVGVMTLPYYLATPTAADPTAPDTQFWQASAASAPDKTSTFTTRFNPTPIATVKQLQVPVLMTVPNGTAPGAMPKPGTGWPIVIFEHGTTADRTNLIALGDSLALGGFVGVAIDQPLHGCTPPFTTQPFCPPLYATSTNPLYAGLGLPASGSIERTFDLTTFSGGKAVDPSGSHFVFAIASGLTLRDDLREGSVDLMTLALSLPTIQLPATGTPPYVDITKIHYIGHSGGSIVGTGFLAVFRSIQAVTPGFPYNIQTATLANNGGQFVYLGAESPSFSAVVTPVLVQQSQGLLTPGTSAYAQFLIDSQTAVDSGDPWNYIGQPVLAQFPMHIVEVVGTTPQPAGCSPQPPGPADGCTDQVVPNDATARILSAGNFTRTATTVSGAVPLHVSVSFTHGKHQSFLDPTLNGPVTQEMQREAVSFTGAAIPAYGIGSSTPGTTLTILDPTNILP